MATTHGYYQRMQLHVLGIVHALAASHKAAIPDTRKHAKGLYKACQSSLKICSKTLQSHHEQVQAQEVFGKPFKGPSEAYKDLAQVFIQRVL